MHTSTSSARKVPVTILTGFLGSGKTTLLQRLVQRAAGHRIAILVNEFGEVGVDGELLRTACGCPDEDIVELSNGCLCCTVQEEFLPTMMKLMERKDQLDHVVIETSGLALPKPLLRAFRWPDLRPQITVDAVVTVADAAGVATGRLCDRERVQAQRLADEALDHEPTLEELFEDQLTCADLVVVTKRDLVDEATYAEVEAMLRRRVWDRVKVLPASYGDLPVDVLLGVGAAAELDIDSRPSHHEAHHEAHHGSEEEHAHDHEHDHEQDPEHAHEHEHEHDHEHDEAIDSVVVELEAFDAPGLLVQALKALVAEHEVYRIKGFVDVRDKPMRLVLQGVGDRFDHYFDRPWRPGEPRATKLVFIGRHLRDVPLAEALRGVPA